jgi:hypothetical protein
MARHEQMVIAFLEGTSNVGMAQIIDLIYHHPQSRPVKAHLESRQRGWELMRITRVRALATADAIRQ